METELEKSRCERRVDSMILGPSKDPSWRLPNEIFQMVLEVFYDDSDFQSFDSCRLVCRRWAQLALKVARDVVEARSYKARDVRVEPFMLTSDVTFTGLKALTLTKVIHQRAELGPGTDNLDLVTSFVRDRCPNLRALHLFLENEQVDLFWLLRLLQHSLQLKELTFAFEYFAPPSDSVMVHLATRRRLRVLCTKAVIHPRLANLILKQTTIPFQGTRELEIGMEGDLLHGCILGAHNARLEHLTITVPSDFGLKNLHFLHIPNLLTLDIHFKLNGSIDNAGMSGLTSHPILYRLSIYARRTLRLPTYTVDEFREHLLRSRTLKYVSLGQGDDLVLRGKSHPCSHLLKKFGDWERGRPMPTDYVPPTPSTIMRIVGIGPPATSVAPLSRQSAGATLEQFRWKTTPEPYWSVGRFFKWAQGGKSSYNYITTGDVRHGTPPWRRTGDCICIQGSN